MITSIAIENFKCFRKLDLRPRLLTVFIGPNGSGKSSVLQALLLLKQSLGQQKLVARGNVIDLPLMERRAAEEKGPNSIKCLGLGGLVELPGYADVGIGEQIEYSYQASFKGTDLIDSTGKIKFNFHGQEQTIRVADNSESKQGLIINTYAATLSRVRQTGRFVQVHKWDVSPGDNLELAFSSILEVVGEVLRQIRFVPAARGFTRPEYLLRDEPAPDLSLSVGSGLFEEQAVTNMVYRREFEDVISAWLHQVTGVKIRGGLVPGPKSQIESLTPVGIFNIVAEGFGTNALILLLLQLAVVSRGAAVLIEEPEIHLHPRAQANLASLLAEEAKAKNKQLIMTTHSEHILGRLLTLVAERKLSAEDLAIYAFEKDESGDCGASALEVTDDGRVKGGIKDFFEPDLEELDRYIKGLQQRA